MGAMQVPEEKTITFTFASHPNKEPTRRWTARLTFPAGAGANAILPLAVEDGNGAPIASAVFELAGQKVPIRDGLGRMTYAAFIAGRHDPALWLHLPDGEPIPGGLTFR